MMYHQRDITGERASKNGSIYIRKKHMQGGVMFFEKVLQVIFVMPKCEHENCNADAAHFIGLSTEGFVVDFAKPQLSGAASTGFKRSSQDPLDFEI